MSEITTIQKSNQFNKRISELARKNMGLISIFISVLAIIVALLIGAVLIALARDQSVGSIQLHAKRLLWDSVRLWRNPDPFCASGVSPDSPFPSLINRGFFNVGAEGQLYMGGLGAVLAGIYLKDLPPRSAYFNFTACRVCFLAPYGHRLPGF